MSTSTGVNVRTCRTLLEPTHRELSSADCYPQVLRWSALGFGVFYGIYHQSSIKTQERTRRFNQEYQHKEQLITKAKAEFLKKTLPPEKMTAGGDSMFPADSRAASRVLAGLAFSNGTDFLIAVITDPNDPKFDLEAYLTMKEAGEK